MKTILMVSDSLDASVGGAELSTRDMIWLFSGNEIDVRFVTSTENKKTSTDIATIHKKNFIGTYFQRGSWAKLRNYRCAFNYRALFAILKAIKLRKPDVVVFNNISDQVSYASILLVKLLRVPAVHILRDTMALTHGKFVYGDSDAMFRVSYWAEARRTAFFFNPIKSIWAKYCLNKANAVISISHELSKFFTYNGVRVDEVIHNGVVIAKKNDANQSIAEVDGKTIFWPARFSVLKGALAILEMFSEINDPSIKLVITADKKDIKDERLLSIIGSNKNIIFTGWLSKTEIDTLYAKASVVVYPSLYLEPFGRVPVEAMSHKKPVIVSNCGGLREIVLHEYNGLVIDPENKLEFVKAINKICSDPAYASILGENGYKRYKQHFTGDVMIKKYIALIDILVRSHD
jgi:glycosyltransferase involved in cell wall biosynthesis